MAQQQMLAPLLPSTLSHPWGAPPSHPEPPPTRLEDGGRLLALHHDGWPGDGEVAQRLQRPLLHLHHRVAARMPAFLRLQTARSQQTTLRPQGRRAHTPTPPELSPGK